jgi:beta-galactosidase GanA
MKTRLLTSLNGRLRQLVCAACLAVVVLAPPAAHASSLPRLVAKGSQVRLEVQGQPFLILGGELGNSSASDLNDLARHWAGLKAMGLNTVIAPVYWELSEPVEGRFDWTVLEGLVRQAREQDMKVVLLWFGAWKNSMSSYAPAWVKTDLKRFPRVRDASGRAQEIVGPWVSELLRVDVRAFEAMMATVARLDPEGKVVIAVQVENEIGMLPDARDHSPDGDRLWAAEVPGALLQRLAEGTWPETESAVRLWRENGRRDHGTWSQVFGESLAAQEIFTAWHFATFVQQLAQKGKAKHALPMYVNAALIRPGYQPGQYPSGGPLPHLFNVWRTAAPSVDLLAPDIYFQAFAEWAARYHRPGHPLLIPEALRSPDAAVNALYAFGEHRAIGFSPFGIESVDEPARSLIRQSYACIRGLSPWLTGEREGASIGLLPEVEQRQPKQRQIAGFTVRTTFERARLPNLADGVPIGLDTQTAGPSNAAGGLLLQIGPDEFVAAGMGMTMTFTPESGDDIIGILETQEGEFVDGRWVGGRWLNGDQTHQGRHIRLEPGRITMQRFKLYRYR